MKLTIDASVFVAAARSIEPHYAVSVATLVTWDNAILQRGASLVTVVTPEEWLNSQPPNFIPSS